MIHTLSVVIPAFNEENTIQPILDQVLNLKINWKDGFRAIYCIFVNGLFIKRVFK